MRATLLALLTLTAAGACAVAPGPGDAGYAYNLSGSYVGRFDIDGQPFDATLQLRTSPGGSVRGAFRVGLPVDIEGSAEGALIRDLLRIDISYVDGGGCRSHIAGILTVERGGGTIEGPVTVTDCGTETAGRMRFRRQVRRPGGGRQAG